MKERALLKECAARLRRQRGDARRSLEEKRKRYPSPEESEGEDDEVTASQNSLRSWSISNPPSANPSPHASKFMPLYASIIVSPLIFVRLFPFFVLISFYFTGIDSHSFFWGGGTLATVFRKKSNRGAKLFI